MYLRDLLDEEGVESGMKYRKMQKEDFDEGVTDTERRTMAGIWIVDLERLSGKMMKYLHQR